MKELKKSIFLFLIISIFIGGMNINGWAQEIRGQEMKVSGDLLNTLDILIARPAGIVAAAVGTCLFVVGLPFTLPTRSAKESFDLFVVKPWTFSFVREFPDEDYI
jgi:hypothetical protein